MAFIDVMPLIMTLTRPHSEAESTQAQMMHQFGRIVFYVSLNSSKHTCQDEVPPPFPMVIVVGYRITDIRWIQKRLFLSQRRTCSCTCSRWA